MIYHLTSYLIVITFFISLKVTHGFGELALVRDPPTGNDTSVNLTCVSDDDGAALIWNYYYNIHESSNRVNISTDFEPKKPTPEIFKECALWNSTKCFGKWEYSKEWDLVDSAMSPMAPVFDYRWEGFKEIFSETFIDQENQYVRELKDLSGTVMFSARGARDVNIFLCRYEDPEKGPCLRIIIGSSWGKRSEIQSCLNGTHDHEQCVDVAKVTHGAPIIDAYEWRTFRLQWYTDKKTIKIFNNTDVDPFLEGTLDQWHPVSHLSVENNMGSRIRFHFYEYLLTREKNAVLSTTEFLQPDKHFCLELMVGLCPGCRLNVTLVNSGAHIPIKSISGIENSGCHDLLTWRSVRINTTSLNLDLYSKVIKLNIETVPNKDGVEGRWAIDNFRTCEPVGGLRKSTIPIHQVKFTSTTFFWPRVTCQKLFYAGNMVVDSSLSNHNPYSGVSRKPILEVTPDDNELTVTTDQSFQTSRDGTVDRHLIRKRDNVEKNTDDAEYTGYEDTTLVNASLLGRKVGRKYRRGASHLRKLIVYEFDYINLTMYVRLNQLESDDEIEYYRFSIEGSEHRYEFPVANHDLMCKLWEDFLCFKICLFQEDLEFASTGSSNLRVDTIRKGDGTEQFETDNFIPSVREKHVPSAPPDVTLNYWDNGIADLKWRHPLIPHGKIDKFQIELTYETRLLKSNQVDHNSTIDFNVTEERKKYETQLYVTASSKYNVTVTAIHQNLPGSPRKLRNMQWTPSRMAFENKTISSGRRNKTWFEFEVPAVINATRDTWVTVTVEGSLECTQNALSESPSTPSDSRTFVYQVNETTPRQFMIGDNDTHDPGFPCSPQPGHSYTIRAEAIDRFSDETAATITSSEIILPNNDDDLPNPSNRNLGWLAIFPILAIVLPLLVVCYRKREKPSMEVSGQESSSIEKTEHGIRDRILKRTVPSGSMKNQVSIESERPAPDLVPKNSYSFPVQIDQFEEHTKDALASGLLKAQYEKISKYPVKTCAYGSLPENITKNRYQDLIAYDHSRVKLEIISDDSHSDYINANYIQGYDKEKYIATQGPKFHTVKDFWRMIWQEKVTVICMLANVKEGKKTKCEKYWPDVGTKLKYGNMLITNTNHKVFADYTVRTLSVACRQQNRTITHLHYTGWPDHGVPMYTQSLVAYIKKLRAIKPEGAPVVVHCSAGVGRTGTIILCDICLSQADEEKFVDLLATTVRMREDRGKMVDTEQQYLLAHLTIVESRISEETQIPCNNISPEKITELKTRLPSDVKRLDEIVWQERALHDLAKPRRPAPGEMLPDEVTEPFRGSVYNFSEQPYTSGIPDNYMNAVSVDGVKMKKQYLAARLPSASTLPDFWKLIAEQGIELVVILQYLDAENPEFCDIIPDGSNLVPVSDMLVETKVDSVKEEHFSVRKLSLTDISDEKKSQPVTVLTCNGWESHTRGKPPAPGALVKCWIASEKISRKESPTLVICRDGITGCGLYLALSFLLERMAVEGECDVISAVRAVRRSQPEFMKSMDQFRYLYDAAMNYHESFKTYANFASF